MHNDELDPLIHDPDLSTPQACRALLELARRRSPRDPDIAGDVVLLLSERLMPGGMLRRALTTHPNPAALLNAAASNAANQAREHAGRAKRRIPLTSTATTPNSNRSSTHTPRPWGCSTSCTISAGARTP